MKRQSLAAAIATAAMLCACAAHPPQDASTTRLSADYEATGDASGMRAFVYGKRTVLEFSSRPLWLSVQDENGVTVAYEREGRYYRLPRTLGHFTVRINTRVLSFSPVSRPVPVRPAELAAPTDAAPSAAPPPDAAPTMTSPVVVSATAEPEDVASVLLRLAAAQRADIRRAILEAGSAAEAQALSARLNRIEAQLPTAASVIIRVQFDTAATDFSPDEQLARALVPAARAAQHVNIRGRTDARVAGSDDARIAFGRALAARQFLIEHGVDGSKIKVSARPAGDFVAPVRTDTGRALNRRVEIELVDHRHTERRQDARLPSRTAP